MPMKPRSLFIILCAATLLTGCSVMAKMIFGIEEIKEYDEGRVETFLAESQRKVPCTQLVATAAQVDNLIRLDLDTNMMQHRGQPVQVLYFDNDSLVFYHINCYTQYGPLSYDWNHYGSFDRFPPAPTIVDDPHGSMTLGHYRAILPGVQSDSRYTVVILWNNMLRKVAAKAVDAVATNTQGRSDCTVVLVNTDRWLVDYIHRTEKQQQP